MIFVILGIAAVLCFGRFVSADDKKDSIIPGCLLIALIIAIVILANLAPPMEYEDNRTIVSVIELEEINEGCFVCQSGEYYVYDSINSSRLSYIEIEDCEIVEEVECILPRCEKYQRNSKTSFWSILGFGRSEYVIYIPTGMLND